MPSLTFSADKCCYQLKQNKFSKELKPKKEIGVTLLAVLSL